MFTRIFTRRDLLKSLMLTGGLTLLPLGARGWALAAPEPTNRRLIVILMRGAVDGLSLVTPYREQNYYQARSNIALSPPGQTDGLIDLDGFFGLNPSLSPLMPLWQNRTLAFVHASGSPAETRSHFEAQDIMEAALLNSAAATQGWMNGLVQALPDNHSATRALSFGNTMPKIFEGPANVATVPNGIKGGHASNMDTQTAKEFGQLYGGNPKLGGLYQEAVSAREGMMQDLQGEMMASGKNAPGADAFVTQSQRVAEMINRDPSIQLVFMDVGGWDTHVNQGNAKGQLANKLGKLGEALAALTTGLGDQYRNTTILIMSEFGRTVAQNGNNGTDHGHGNVAWLMGGDVKGGKVYTRWPGLNPNQLWEGRDLAVTTDFRSVIGTTVAGTFGLGNDALSKVIAGYKPDTGLQGIVG
jgi:uncharacterized protein (DUF1501 family)